MKILICSQSYITHTYNTFFFFFFFFLFASHDIDRQLLTIQCLIDVITQDAYQIKSPYTEEDDALTWGRVCVLVGRLLISGIRAAKRSVTFTASAASTRQEEEKEDEEEEEEEEEEEFGTSVKGQQQPRSAASATPNNVIFHCKFRDDRTSSLVENCIVAIHALASLPYVPLSMDSPTMKLMLISLGRARGSLSNSQFFVQGMIPENNSWPEKTSEMILQTTILFLKEACHVNNR